MPTDADLERLLTGVELDGAQASPRVIEFFQVGRSLGSAAPPPAPDAQLEALFGQRPGPEPAIGPDRTVESPPSRAATDVAGQGPPNPPNVYRLASAGSHDAGAEPESEPTTQNRAASQPVESDAPERTAPGPAAHRRPAVADLTAALDSPNCQPVPQLVPRAALHPGPTPLRARVRERIGDEFDRRRLASLAAAIAVVVGAGAAFLWSQLAETRPAVIATVPDDGPEEPARVANTNDDTPDGGVGDGSASGETDPGFVEPVPPDGRNRSSPTAVDRDADGSQATGSTASGEMGTSSTSDTLPPSTSTTSSTTTTPSTSTTTGVTTTSTTPPTSPSTTSTTVSDEWIFFPNGWTYVVPLAIGPGTYVAPSPGLCEITIVHPEPGPSVSVFTFGPGELVAFYAGDGDQVYNEFGCPELYLWTPE